MRRPMLARAGPLPMPQRQGPVGSSAWARATRPSRLTARSEATRVRPKSGEADTERGRRMARMVAWMVAALGLATSMATASRADEGVLLREQAGEGASRVLIEMRAEGELRLDAEPKGAAAKAKP